MERLAAYSERFRSHRRFKGAAGVFAFAFLVLAGCASGSLYRPKGAVDGIGYADEQITLTHYHVSFSGNRDTPRAQVEDYLLRRAAEITVQAGYTHFAFNGRTTEADTQYYVSGDSWSPGTGLGFGLGRRHPERSEYFSNWAFPAYWSPDQAAPLTRYTASSEIVMLTPDQAAQSPAALSARDILNRLAPSQAASGPVAAVSAATP